MRRQLWSRDAARAVAEVRMRAGEASVAVRIVEEAMPAIDKMGAAPLRAQAEDLRSRASRSS
ncbi:hypothetical protein AB0K05_12400 [Nonomuraea sp. NPDC049486]|uniref:hypothetical protein n=1 Tax=Nonomuraea sp. NPDC049486 TaxID=3155773 RepID=UPI00343DF668